MTSFNGNFSDVVSLIIRDPFHAFFTVSLISYNEKRRKMLFYCSASLPEPQYFQGDYMAYLVGFVDDCICNDVHYVTLESVSFYISDDSGMYVYDCCFSIEM